MFDQALDNFRRFSPDVDFCSIRCVNEYSEHLRVRQNVLQPVFKRSDSGAMVTVVDGQGLGYAATSDLSARGVENALDVARQWANRTASLSVTTFSDLPVPSFKGEYATPVKIGWASVPLEEKIDILKCEGERLNIDPRIVDWEAGLWHTHTNSVYLNNRGGDVRQEFHFLVPTMRVTANEGMETQVRSLGGGAYCRQGGLEVLEQIGFRQAAPRLASEALALLAAPNCPSGTMDVLLDADQMILQIHESIGHPLELDRILGDERNYAGTSFVTLDMFGSYRYGSDLLNITYDPTVPEEFASFGFDDDGVAASKEYIIRRGILERPLGSIASQQRAGTEGVANSRACSWNRPPIDRMANLNLEPGPSSLDEMIASIEKGIYMKTNNSWSIDDSRNKFQFGCEWGQIIENGELKQIVKKPNYRGISATFWRSLKKVGNSDTRDILGTPFCGKGEPNQCIRVGHASPACVFENVDVFGGE